MKKYGGLEYFEDGGDAGSDGGDDGSADAGAPSGADSEDAAMGAALSDTAPSIGAPGENSDPSEGNQEGNNFDNQGFGGYAENIAPGGGNFGPGSEGFFSDLGTGTVASQMGLGVSDANFGPGSSGFFSDLGYDPVASQMGLGVVNSGPVATNGMTQGELQNMQANGLGGSMISPTQTVDQALASMNFNSFMTNNIGSIVSSINPAFGTAMAVTNAVQGLLSGNSTLGNSVVNTAISLVANQMGIPPSVVSAVANGNPGQAVSSATNSAITSALASALGIPGSAISGLMNASGVSNALGSNISSGVNTALGVTPSGPSNTSTVASAINNAINGVTTGLGGNTSTASAAPTGPGASVAESTPVESTPGQAAGSAQPSTGEIMAALGSLGGLSAATSGGLSNVNQSPGWLNTEAQMIKSNVKEDAENAPNPVQLAELQNLYSQISPELMDLFARRGLISPSSFASGGNVETTTSIWGDMSKYTPKFAPNLSTHISTGPSRRQPIGMSPLRQMRTSMMLGSPDNLAKGGLPSKYAEAAPKGHKPEFITGLTGYYAQGRGTGQSDDIPAMLHDGDYVMDADTVAALGDGSSKAGAEALSNFQGSVPHDMSEGGSAVPAKIADGEYVFPASFVTSLGGGDNKKGSKMLDEMRERLRAHKRSAPTSKIPPKAKSPLDYLGKAKG